MNVINSEDVFFQKCYYTGELLNEGLVVEDGDIYIVDSKEGHELLLEHAKTKGRNYKDIEESYEDGFHYYTVWDGKYQEENSVMYFYDSDEILYYREKPNEDFINSITKEKYKLIFDNQ